MMIDAAEHDDTDATWKPTETAISFLFAAETEYCLPCLGHLIGAET
jgi:hypothetical protein